MKDNITAAAHSFTATASNNPNELTLYVVGYMLTVIVLMVLLHKWVYGGERK